MISYTFPSNIILDNDNRCEVETEEEVMENGIKHVKNAHNMKEEDITPEMQQKIKGLIRSS